jgi:hypothetical protein
MLTLPPWLSQCLLHAMITFELPATMVPSMTPQAITCYPDEKDNKHAPDSMESIGQAA